MAREANFDESANIFIGEDKTLEFTVWDDDADPPVPLDVSSYTDIVWIVRKNEQSETALISKDMLSGVSVVGTYSSNPNTNTQRIRVTLADTDTYPDSGTPIPPGRYRHSLKNHDPDTILAFGRIVLRGATARL